jgi:hypothetical protein
MRISKNVPETWNASSKTEDDDIFREAHQPDVSSG